MGKLGVAIIWLGIAGLFPAVTAGQPEGAAWVRHTIDATSRGADGVRLADINGDDRLDVATGWEEGGVVRVYLHPGPRAVRRPWPRVTVGRVGSPEDAVFVDLDADGFQDVVSCCEGSVQTVFVHWSPRSGAERLNPSAWLTQRIPVTENQRRWMFCVPMQVDGLNGVDLVAGAKNPGAAVGWLRCPRDPRDLPRWRWHEIYRAGWIMSLVAIDMDVDGDMDILVSDRKGIQRGCHWVENPGTAAVRNRLWKVHPIGGQGQEVMFLTPCDLDRDGRVDVAVAVRGGDLLYFRCERLRPLTWRTWPIHMPPGTGTGKAVAAGDLNLDGRVDLVVSCENARGRSGVFWLSWRGSVFDAEWDAHEISGREEGTKYDLVRLIDLDEDGDLDVLTCEERDNLGVIWYENPTR